MEAQEEEARRRHCFNASKAGFMQSTERPDHNQNCIGNLKCSRLWLRANSHLIYSGRMVSGVSPPRDHRRPTFSGVHIREGLDTQ
jgi:hypothetical protein